MLYIQDPDYTKSVLLHDAILDIMDKAIYGIATYAFVTNEGLQLLFESENFEKFINKDGSKFILLMGIDEVTNTRTLVKARALTDKYTNLEIKVFLIANRVTYIIPSIVFLKQSREGL